MNQWIDSIDQNIPSEGWKEGIENGKQLIYQRGTSSYCTESQCVTVNFKIATVFYEQYLPNYWGYIENSNQ